MKFQNFVQQILSSKRSNTLVNEHMLQRQISSNFCIFYVGLASYFLFFVRYSSLAAVDKTDNIIEVIYRRLLTRKKIGDPRLPSFSLFFSLFGNILFPKPVQLITFLS